jgi:hypothetical protein
MVRGFKQSWSGFKKGLVNMLKPLQEAWQELIGAFGGMSESWKGGTSLLSGIGSGLAKLVLWLTSNVIFRALVWVLTTLVQGVTWLIGVIKWVGNVIQPLLAAMGRLGDAISSWNPFGGGDSTSVNTAYANAPQYVASLATNANQDSGRLQQLAVMTANQDSGMHQQLATMNDTLSRTLAESKAQNDKLADANDQRETGNAQRAEVQAEVRPRPTALRGERL